jgi:hypothetical protein
MNVELINKCYKVIESCETLQQRKTALTYINIATKEAKRKNCKWLIRELSIAKMHLIFYKRK